MIRSTPLIALLASAALALSASAADRGRETNLPLPRFVSMKAKEGYMRRGPSRSHRIDWVLKHRNMPLQVVDEYGHWRRVVDREGAGGWMHYSLLSGARTVLIEEDMAAIHMRADDQSPVTARAELGAIARLTACDPAWCRIRADGVKGYIRRSKLWGLLPGEWPE